MPKDMRRTAPTAPPPDYQRRVFRGISRADVTRQAEADVLLARANGYDVESQAWSDDRGTAVLTVDYQFTGQIPRATEATGKRRRSRLRGIAEFLVILVGIALVVAYVMRGAPASSTTTTRSDVNRQVVTMTGQGYETTRKFTLEGDYRLDWRVWDTGGSTVGCYHGSHLRPGSEVDVSVSPDGGQTRRGQTHVYDLDAGQYHFEVISGCAWELELVPI